jgi:4-amino-4-deoxy-L-arabinose transferase-like glycosyltransferase
MIKKPAFLIIIILILAATLRLWCIGMVPVSPDWDEAALGYNAYSIYHTGRDEYGKFLPVVLKSFDDYKPALYAYTIIPFLPLFDLSILAVRLPSALFGILTVFMTYLLVKELFKRSDIALVSAFFMSISPWHIQFSRIAFESNLGLTCNVIAAYFFVKGLKKPGLLSLSTTFAALGIYAYQSEKVFVPLLFVMLLSVFCKEVLSLPRKYLISALLIGLVVMLPMVVAVVLDHHSLSRAKQTSVFAKQTDLLDRYEKRITADKEKGDIIGILFDSKPLYFAKEVMGGYISHFNYRRYPETSCAWDGTVISFRTSASFTRSLHATFF